MSGPSPSIAPILIPGVVSFANATTTQAQTAVVFETVPGVELGVAPFTLADQLLLMQLANDPALAIVAGVVTPEQYGAKGDGVTDDTAALTAALAAMAASTTLGSGYKALLLGANRTYLVSARLNVPATCAIIGQGDCSILATVSDINVLRVAGNDVLFQSFKIQGNGVGVDQVGIANQPVGSGAASGFLRVRVINVTFSQLATAGMLTYQLPGPPPYYSTFALNPRCEHCGIGLWFLGEYSTVIGMQIDACTVGVDVEGGNQIYIGGSITACGTAVKLDGGGNDGHGVFTGIEANHNTAFLLCTGVLANGYIFRGCEIYQGAINLLNTNGLQFESCQIDAPISFDGSTGTVFKNCMFPSPQAYGGTITNNANAHASTSAFIGCTQQDGTTPAFVAAATDGSAIGCNVPIAVKRGAAVSGGGTFVVTLVPGTDIPNDGALTLSATVQLAHSAGGHVDTVAGLVAKGVFSLKNGTPAAVAAIATSTNPFQSATYLTTEPEASDAGFGAATAVFTISGGHIVLTVTNPGATSATAQVVFDAKLLIP